jgi:hypothetical protein
MRLQNLILKLPPALRLAAEHLPIRVFRWKHDLAVRAAWRSGPPYRPSHKRIIIDITASCDLGCMDCNRSCGAQQAPAPEHMTVDQVNRFISESKRQHRCWNAIQIEGGEPTRHPQFLEIVNMLHSYVRRDSPSTVIQVNTAGYSRFSRGVVRQLPPAVIVYCSEKTQVVQPGHLTFNVAPIDIPGPSKYDFSQGCFLPSMYGLGLTRYGYYPHPICGGIDRVFGMDIGRKTLPDVADLLDELFPRLCRYCGLFVHYNRALQPALPKRSTDSAGDSKKFPSGTMTESWSQAYAGYRAQPPSLRPY